MPRADLAATFHQLARVLIAHEQPILEGHGMSMWEYIALDALREGPSANQNALAETIGYDRSRLVSLLDQLEQRGFVERERNEPDRRAHRVRVTDAGLAAHATVQRAIRRMETRFLSRLPADERASLLAALARLSSSRSPP